MSRRRDPILNPDTRVFARVMWVIGALFLLAQWGAQAHAYSHDHRPEVAVQGLQAHEGCGLCERFAPLLAGAALGAAPMKMPVPATPPPSAAVTVCLCKTPSVLAFRSRAPLAAS